MNNQDSSLNVEASISNLPQSNNKLKIFKFFVFSMIGVFMFFIPITVNGKSSIALSHVAKWVEIILGAGVPYYVLVLVILGAVHPFYSKTWNKNTTTTIFSIFKVMGLITTVMVILNIGPNWILAEGIGPFLFNVLVKPLSIVLPIGSTFLALLTGYGLLEFFGVLLERVMRPIWKTPGRSAIDAVASFVGSPSMGIIITDRVFSQGKYTIKEAAIIITGFSAVSVPIMVVGLEILGLMHMWNLFFWLTLIITFLVTAITARIWPLSKMKNEYNNETVPTERNVIAKGRYLKTAWDTAMEAVDKSPGFFRNCWNNLSAGLLITMAVLPSIMSIGLLGLVLVEYTPVFDILGFLLYPFTMFLPEPLLAAKAAFVGFASTPMISLALVAQASMVTKFVISVLFVSGILFFSEVIPVIWSTSIPIRTRDLVIIWFQRAVLTLIIATPIAYLLF
ncbi:YjiH family protein [Peribacillus butanolivorans]|uniref:YjiH family protein n=1 Tax=Peribacillus butanolivorans TaxID=421767 RepID=UPI0030C9CFE1